MDIKWSKRKIILQLLAVIICCALPGCASQRNDTHQEDNKNSEVMESVKDKEEKFRNTAPEAGEAPMIQIGTYQQAQLENGLQLIVVENRKLPKVSFQLFVDRPPVNEGKRAGYVEIAGNILKAGTLERSKLEIDEVIDFMGASLSTNSKGIKASSLSKHKEALLEVMSDIAMRPAFAEEEFHKAIKQKLSAIAAGQNNPSAIASNIRKKVNFEDHPYGNFPTEASVRNIRLKDCKEFYENYFHPNHSYLVAVGDITLEEARALGEQYFSTWEKGDMPLDTFSVPERPSKRQVVMVDLPAAVQSLINITYPAEFNIASEDYIAATVMNHILGGGVFSGYLMQNLREDKGFTYGARSQLSSDRHIGYFNAYANVGNQVTDSAIVEFLREMNRIRNERVSEEHLELVKNSLSGSFARSLENPQTVAKQALAMARFQLPEDFFKTYLQRIESVTAEEVQEVAKKYIHPSQCHVLVIGNREAVADEIRRFDADEAITYYNTSGEKIDLLKQDLPEGVTADFVIHNYIEAIGGEKRIDTVHTIQWKVDMNLMSMEMEGTRYIIKPDKYADISKVNGMEVRKIVFDGKEGYTFDPRSGREEMPVEEKEEAKLNAHIFKEKYYDSLGYKIELIGLEEVEGEKAYKLRISKGEGVEIHEYYSKESGLKLREMSRTQGPNGPIPVTTDYMDYESYEGILFPTLMTVSGPFPEPMRMQTRDIEINVDIDEDIFDQSGN